MDATANASSTGSSATAAGDSSELFHRFKVGDLEFTSLSDGYLEVPAVFIASDVDPAELLGFLAAMGESTEISRTPISCLHVYSPQHGNILVDSGLRHLPGPVGIPLETTGKLPRALEAAGIAPADIDIVLLSHVHPDHFGGLYDENDDPVFPNATHYVSQEEVEFWGGEPSLAGTLMPPPKAQLTIDLAQRYLKLARQQGLRTFAAGTPVLEGIDTISLEGHTPGQVGYLFDTNARKLLFTADAAGHRFVSIKRPEWRFAFDTDAPLAMTTRKRLIRQLLEEGWLTFTPHFPWPGVGSLTSGEDGPTWVPGTR